MLAASGLAVWVTVHAWVSEDAFITFRYVSNTLDGHGAVFNLGERVQGYTHPAWFVLLVLGSWIHRDPILVSIALSVAATAGLVWTLGRGLLRGASSPAWALSLLAMSCVVMAGNRAWTSFQTAGLENSLAHLCIVALIVEVWPSRAPSGPARLGLILALLVLTRPDLGLLAAPVAAGVAALDRRARTWKRMLLGFVPAIAWGVFALAYYGSVVPNTARAKLGLWSSWEVGMAQGFAYLADWYAHEPVSLTAAALLLACGAWQARTSLPRAACVAGLLAHGAFVVWIGGGFMRGRLLLPAFVGSLVVGVLALAERARPRPLPAAALAPLFVLAFVMQAWLTGPPDPVVNEHGIVDERAYYPGYDYTTYLRTGELVNPSMDLRFAEELREFAEVCGPVTVHTRNPGTLGYLAGPRVSVIDTLGLTDAYIANLPRSRLVEDRPRPGHPDKIIPADYLASRQDICLIEGWEAAVHRRDCSILEKASRLRDYVDRSGP